MEYVSQKLRSFTSLFSRRMKDQSPCKIKRNIYLESIINILSWNDPFLSWCSFLAMNFLFWCTVQFELKLLGLIFFTVLILFIYDNLFNAGSLELDITLSKEMEHYFHVLSSFISTMSILRKESPSAFCLAMSIFFILLSFVARNISGILLTYLIISALFFLPLGYKKLPMQVKSGIRQALNSLTSHGIIEEADLIPVQGFNKLDDNCDVESLDTDITADSVTNSLISGISSMPSFLDAEDNHEILEEDLLPLNRELTPNLGDLSSDSDSELKDMRFRDTHFSKDSSSDEGSKFEEGLHFSEDTSDSTTKQQGTNKLVQDFVGYVASAASAKGFQLPDFINNALGNSQGTKVNRENSSSESDFEIIDPDESK